MKRTKPPQNNNTTTLDKSNLVGRSTLAALLGFSFDGNRNIYEALGYDVSISLNQYAAQYARQDIAKAVIKRPVDMTWKGGLCLSQGSDEDETPFEKAYKDLDDRLGLKSKFKRADKLSALGHYGVLLLGLNDVKSIQDFTQSVSGGDKKLMYVKPYAEKSVEIYQYENNPNNPRYGLPLLYQITMSHPSGKSNSTIYVHHSRIIHVTGELLESEVNGVPELQVIWNRLKDLEKILGGSAEMFWLGARPGFQADVKDDYKLNQNDYDDMKSQIDEYEHGLRRIMRTKGVDLNALKGQVEDPTKHWEVQIQAISAITGIPKRILTGSERGELSSGQDRTEWLEKIQDRRDEFASPQIVRPFVERCIQYGVLPNPGSEGYDIAWEDLFAPSEKDKAEVGKIRAEALKAYGSVPGLSEVITQEQFIRFFLGLPDEIVDKIMTAFEQAKQQEQETEPTEEEEEML